MSERQKRPKHADQNPIDNPQPLAASAVPPEEAWRLDAAPPADEEPLVTGYADDVDDYTPAGCDETAYREEIPPLNFGSAQRARVSTDSELLIPDETWFSAPKRRVAGPAAPGADPRSADAGRAARLTPPIQARRDIVTVLVAARFDAWYDQWMLQASVDTAALDVDYFDDAVRMLEPAAVGMALAALRAHLDSHQTLYTAAGLTLLIEPCILEGDELACLLGVLETMHEDERGRRNDGELSFIEMVEHAALAVPVYRDPDSPFSRTAFAPGDPFFSAIDGSPFAKDATLAKVRTHPERYALIDLQVTTLFARLALRGGAGDETTERAMTA